MSPCQALLEAVAAIVASCALSSTAPAAAHPLRASDGGILVNGQRRLIIGLYENPTDDAVFRQAVAAGFDLFHCGADQNELDRVQRFGAMGWISVGGDLDLSTDAVARASRLQDVARRFSKHPALLFWEGPDEALWSDWSTPPETVSILEWPAMDTVVRAHTGAEADALGALRDREVDLQKRALWAEAEKVRRAFWQRAGQEPPKPDVRLDSMPQQAAHTALGLAAGMRVLRTADPGHMIWLNHAPRNSVSGLLAVNREVDMAGCDIYPIPYNLWVGHSDLVNMRPSSVGDYTDRMRRAAPGKSCAMVLQGFGWRDIEPKGKRSDELLRFGFGRRPTFAESRFMAYDALLHGANALMYWGTAYAHDELPDPKASAQDTPFAGSRFWQDLLAVSRELRALEPALMAPDAKRLSVKVDETYGSIDNAGVRASLRQVGSDWVLLIVNENVEGAAFSVRGLPAALDGVALYRLGSSETQPIHRGTLRDGIAAFDVHVYATSRRFEPASTAAK